MPTAGTRPAAFGDLEAVMQGFTVNSLVLLGILGVVFAVSYRYYSAFVAYRVAQIDDSRPTPSITKADGRDYVKTNKHVLFGHHFAAISAAGPLVGPVLAAQFGFLPGALWIIFGAALGGAVHDFIILFASVRHGGATLAELARRETSRLSGSVAVLAILFIIVLLLAALALVFVKAVEHSAWAMFTIMMTVPAALTFGMYAYRIRPGQVFQGSLIGVAIVIAGVFLGKVIADSGAAHLFTYAPEIVKIGLPVYGLICATLPVWVLLCPRDYLSTYMKIGTIALLVIGVVVVHPHIKMPALTPFGNGSGPVLPGQTLFPFCFITIACGAMSGFHALIGTGTTPRMVPTESATRYIGYGAMLTEGVVAMMALIAATTLSPGDYFAINAQPADIARAGAAVPAPAHLGTLSAMVEEDLVGRTGGAVTLAVGIANILSGIPGMSGLMKYWYHFALMFEAVFILTAIDTGTRVARYMFQDFFGRFWKPLASSTNMWSVTGIGAVVCFCWGWLLYSNQIDTIWPLFGMANQLLAVVALCVATSFVLRTRPTGYALVTLVPAAWITFITSWAGVLNVQRYFSPGYVAAKGTTVAYVDGVLSAVLIVLVWIIIVDSIRKWVELAQYQRAHHAPLGEAAFEPAP
jgi:carbon starvation protein